MNDSSEKQHARREKIEGAVQSCYSTWATSYFDEYYRSRQNYPPVHQKIVRDAIVKAGAQHVIDAGCGPASMLRTLVDLKIDLCGFDLTIEMVEEARRVMVEAGLGVDRVWQGSVVDAEAYRVSERGPYDAAICVGVLPHLREEDDRVVLSRLHDAVSPDGLVVVEARNQLFSLFTLNRQSRDFFVSELIRPESFPKSDTRYLETALRELDDRFRLDLPPLRRGTQQKPGYDEILSRTHNPFVLREQMAAAGFRDVKVLFYHFHALPPMLERLLPETFRAQSMAMENPHDWRGYFMASAFLLSGQRV